MRRWEYRSTLLYPASVKLAGVNGWRLKEINEEEQPDWKKTEIYPSAIRSVICMTIVQSSKR